MTRTVLPVLTGILISMVILAGCSTIRQGPPPAEIGTDPIVGLWTSGEPGSVTFFRFYENGTFEAWSHTGDIHPKYSFQYFGGWKSLGHHEYAMSGQHIGYGEVTALAIWRDLTIVYDPKSDSFAIPVYDGQIFTRISSIPQGPEATGTAIVKR